ncbi:MAG: hypothetical protein L3J74_12290 [Bacteroidales bacterium]|nr:hypothetical protein [Bacteroidales bacterium]
MLEKKLQKLYFFIITPAFLLIFLFFISEKFNHAVVLNKAGRLLSTLIMIFAAISSVILPVWYKILLLKTFRSKKKITFETFAGYQYRIILTVAFSVYWVFPAYLYQLDEMPMVITGFFVLYGLYYYYPSKRKIQAEKKLFNIDD